MTISRTGVQLAVASVILASAGIAAGYPELVAIGAACAATAIGIRSATPRPTPRKRVRADGRDPRSRAPEKVPLTMLSGADVVFHSLREYQPGDQLRMIHWRATARRGGRPVVREFGEPEDPVEVLLPDTRDLADAPGSWPATRVIAQAALVAAATAVTATLYGGFFAGWDFLPRLIVVTVVACTLATLIAVKPPRAVPAVVAAVAGFALTATYAVLSGTLDDGLPGELTARAGWHALTGGWASMLTIAAPAPDSPQMLMTPALVTWIAAFVAVTLAARTPSVLGPAAVLVCAQVAGLLFAANQPVTHLIQTCALLALLLVLTLLRAGGPPSRRPARRARTAGLGVTLIAAVTAAAALAAIASVPADAAQRFNPRPLLTAPLHLEQALSPLSAVREQVRLPDPSTLFTVTITGPAGATVLVQTVALNAYDGSQWTSSDSYLVAGPVLGPGPVVSGGARLTEHVALNGLTGPYLPVEGRPTQIDASLRPGSLVGFDLQSGTLVADATTLAGASYTVMATRQPEPAGLMNAAAGSGPSLAPYLQLPPAPAQLAALATSVTAKASTPYTRLIALQDYLDGLPVNPDAPPGDSYGTIVRLLTATTAQAKAGFTDQHASAFAILARLEGIPARVVVGYRLRSPSAVQGSSRTYTVTTADAYAWAQAYFPGSGWINFDPSDTSRTVSLPRVVPVPTPPPGPRPSTAPPGTKPATPSPRPRQSPASAAPTAAAGPSPGPAAWPLPASVTVPVLVALACAGVAGTTALTRLGRRRRRHSAGTMATQVLGAWDEAVDRLADVGVVMDGSLTALELAGRATAAGRATQAGAGARVTREQRSLALAQPVLGELAARATEAGFSGGQPDPDAVKRAWKLEGLLSGVLYQGWRAPYRIVHWTIPAPRRRATQPWRRR